MIRVEKGKIIASYGSWDSEVPLSWIEDVVRAMEGKKMKELTYVKITQHTIEIGLQGEAKKLSNSEFAFPQRMDALLHTYTMELCTKAELEQVIAIMCLQ